MTDKNVPPVDENPSNSENSQGADEVIIETPDETTVVVDNARRKPVYAGMWGPLEIVAVSIASFFLLAVFLFYILMVVPAQRELAAGQRERDELDRELTSAREKWGDIRSTETRVAKLITSAEDFESRALKDESIGTTSVYQRINVLINAYGLRNTSGPDYVPFVTGNEKRAGGGQEASKKGKDKYKSLFPGIYITTTVEGSYSNIRRFIRDIETSAEFVAITSVEIEPSDELDNKTETETVEVVDSKGRKGTQSYRKGRYRGNTVSLRIEMAAYFRRPADQRQNTSLPATSTDEDAVSNDSSD